MELEITNRIIKNRSYTEQLSKLAVLEADREFCRHDMEHFLSVARITMHMCREMGVRADRDLVYSAALLHDIGRTQEITMGIPHDIAGQALADCILSEVDCPEDMKAKIIRLIASHRDITRAGDELGRIFCAADKKSRMCFDCSAREKCNWPDDKKNLDIEV